MVGSHHVFAVGVGHMTVYLEHSVVDSINVCATVLAADGKVCALENPEKLKQACLWRGGIHALLG